MPIDVRHNRVHHDHFAKCLFSAVFGGEGEHVLNAEGALEEPVGRDESLAFRCEQGAFAGELFVESKQRIGNVVDFCGVEQIRCELLGARFEPCVRITGGTALQKRDLPVFANPAFRKRTRRRELRGGGGVLPPVHAGAVEGDARDDVIEGIAIERYVIPGQSFVFALHPEGVGQRQAAYHADEVMAGGKAELAHELFDRRSVLGDGSPVDPVVDVDEPVGEIRVESLDFFVAEVVDSLMLAVRCNNGVLVHQLIEHVAPPSGKSFTCIIRHRATSGLPW